MVQKNFISAELPKNPGPKRRDESRHFPEEDNYYINISVQSLLEKYGGRKKGFPISVKWRQIEQLKEMQAMFGENFGWNEIIWFGFYTAKKLKIDLSKFELGSDLLKCEEVYVKPTQKTLLAIVVVGREHAAEQLIDIGFHFLGEKFKENA